MDSHDINTAVYGRTRLLSHTQQSATKGQNPVRTVNMTVKYLTSIKLTPVAQTLQYY